MTFLSECLLLFHNYIFFQNLTFFLNFFLYNSELNLGEGFFSQNVRYYCMQYSDLRMITAFKEFNLFFKMLTLFSGLLRIPCVISKSWLFLEFWLYSKQSDFLLVFDLLVTFLRIPTLIVGVLLQCVCIGALSLVPLWYIQRGYYHNVLESIIHI